MPTQRRPITVREWRTPGELRVLGETIELLYGFIAYGEYPFAVSEEAHAAALAAGIDITGVEESSDEESSLRAGDPRRGRGYDRATERLREAAGDRQQDEDDDSPPLDPEPSCGALPADVAETLLVREHWANLERVLLVLIEEGRLDFATAVSWLAAPDPALSGLSPALWVAAGRDVERLVQVARQDAGRLAR